VDCHLNTRSYYVFAVIMPIWEHMAFKARLISTLAISAISGAVRYN